MKKVDSIGTLGKLLEPFDGIQCYSNSYFFEEELKKLIDSNLLYFQLRGTNLLLFRYNKHLSFFDVFYYLKDNTSAINLVDNRLFVMEIPYRGEKNYPLSIVEFWENSGFKKHINRNLYVLNTATAPEVSKTVNGIDYLIINNVDLSIEILNALTISFDAYTGDILSLDEVRRSIENREIIGAFKNGELAGFLRSYGKKKVSWIGHLAVLPSFEGNGIGSGLVSHYLKKRIDEGFVNFQHWVVSNNHAAIKLYSKFGFVLMNKSSISLIKN